MNKPKVGLFFIDGLGLGRDDARVNPLAAGNDGFAEIIGGPLTLGHIGEGVSLPHGVVIPTDVLLGVGGLPQSATGQTSLLSGENAQAKIGRHLNGFPSPTLRQLLREKGVFRQLTKMGRKAVFANTFTPEYFQGENLRRKRYSATTVAAMAGGEPLKGLEDLAAGFAVYQDITRETLVERGYGVSSVSPRQAGGDLARVIHQNDFTLFEYFQTDRCGHKQDMEWATRIINQLSDFLRGVVEGLDHKKDLLIISSDHGNFEAMDRKTHSTNPVPTMAWGLGAERFGMVTKLTDILPLIIEALSETPVQHDRRSG